MRMNAVQQGILSVLGVCIAAPTFATGITVYKDGEKYLKMGGRIQMQYYKADPDNGSSTDEVFLRRFRPYIEGSIHKDWKGKFQFDFGKASGDNEVAVKDAYMEYKGFDGVKILLGNVKTAFSREFLTSSKKQQLVERTFVGDHNYGSPDRSLGIHLKGSNGENLTWGATFAQANIDPDAKKLDFDTPVNNSGDWNEGWVTAARVDFHPFGILKMSQGDFEGDTKATIGIAAFRWNNDDDNNCYTDTSLSCFGASTSKADVDEVTGFELSGGFRTAGVSIDAQYNKLSADTVNNNFTGGIFRNGSTDLENWAIEGGYMVVPSKLELVAGYQSQDADNYGTEWTRSSFGVNWYIHKHDIKLQTTFRKNADKDGVKGNDEDELFVQAQYVF
ncbi:hypothetical protein MNBD_GAMMA15-2608 [hydrothermal vent metagenome]|uniref:Phosphate-specific outer membrane porin OprP Pyrophosphate-specific outer membrane porin OprO n=1 Tax=hydrothermal vent metagenome TaxID=652676 RepID=A0A3B0YG53_9ZZZZ